MPKSLLTASYPKIDKLIRALHAAGMTAEMASLVIEDKAAAAEMLQPLADVLNPQLFVDGNQQLANAREHFSGVFDEGDFARAEASLSAFRGEGLKALVLVPYLGTVQETFERLLDVAYGPAAEDGNRERYMSWYFKTDSELMRLHEGVEFPRNTLRWEIIDLGANRGKSPSEVRNQHSPHMACLAAAWHHPNWLKAIDGKTVPSIWIPGIEATSTNPGHNDAFRNVPFLGGGVTKGIKVTIQWDEVRYDGTAVPVLRTG